MPSIQEIDKNLAHITVSDGIAFYDVRKSPFSLHGLYHPECLDPFRRIPEEVTAATNEGVKILHTNTAGVCVRFRTDSVRIAIRAEYQTISRFYEA